MYLLSIASLYVPAAKSWSMMPQSFLKFGRPAYLIQTMKCSKDENLNKNESINYKKVYLPSSMFVHWTSFHVFLSGISARDLSRFLYL